MVDRCGNLCDNNFVGPEKLWIHHKNSGGFPRVRGGRKTERDMSMRINGKRIFALLLALALVVCTFAACGGTGEEEEITRGTDAIAAPAPTAGTTAAATTAPSTTAAATAAPSTSKNSGSGNSASSGNSGSGSLADVAEDSGASLNMVTSLINAFGYNYDAKEGVFYTEIDSWQREANFIEHYDILAPLGNMRYQTVRVDFTSGGYDWRIQFWKGQYGPFGGAEIGVYNKRPGTTEDLYYCVDDEHMLYMGYTMYESVNDYRNGTVYFKRPWQKHWWLTGFKVGTVTPSELVMSARIRTFNGEMADAMEKGLKSAGFKEGDPVRQLDTFRRSGFDFYILWYHAGSLNY